MTQFVEIPDTSLVLVAIIPNKRDLDIARMLGWYRIPLKSAPKIISVDYIAFYQTAAFNERERWQIRWMAPIQGGTNLPHDWICSVMKPTTPAPTKNTSNYSLAHSLNCPPDPFKLATGSA